MFQPYTKPGFCSAPILSNPRLRALPPVPQLNPTVELLSEGIVGLLRPSLEGLDSRVAATREAQEQLRKQIQASPVILYGITRY